MSREIKFRAWIKDISDAPVMFYPASKEPYMLISNGDGFGVVYDMEAQLPSDQFVIMQFTGLKDKNGVEIYEGDILAMESVGGERFLIGRIAYDEAKAAFLLHYRHEGADWTGGFGGMFPMSNYVIKGNIHENPDLLEAK